MEGISCESLPPSDFRLYSSLEDSNGAIKVAVENCQLCGSSRRPFFCKDCVNKGRFSHSKCKTGERCSEKLQRWLTLKKERSKLLERFDGETKKAFLLKEKKAKIADTAARVAMLKSATENTKAKLLQEKATLEMQKDKNRVVSAKSERHREKSKHICRYIDKSQAYASGQQQTLDGIQVEIIALRQQHIRNLQELIFPIVEIQPRSSDEDAMAQSMVSALAEARHTAYVRGRWVYTDNSGELRYQIIEPSLPGNGDYSTSAYNIWLMENRSSEPEFEPGQRNPLYTISAALSYTTQMCSLLAHFLDVNLPHRLCYSEFNHELSERHFQRAVYKLNHNILHLCFTQNVTQEDLHPRHTLHNLLLLLHTPHLGRSGCFTSNQELIQSIEEVRHDLDPESSSSSSCSENEDDPDGVHFHTSEWEHVPCTLPEAEIPTRTADVSYFMSTNIQSRLGATTTAAETTTTASMAGGLVTSAAAGVASLWRMTMGGKSDKS